MLLPTAVMKQPKINAAISTVLPEFKPWIRHIRYEIGQDWAGDWAVFFRVMLADETMKNPERFEMIERMNWRIIEELDLPNLGLYPYFDVRTESEQATLQDPSWAALV